MIFKNFDILIHILTPTGLPPEHYCDHIWDAYIL